jgi:hypothetical protein
MKKKIFLYILIVLLLLSCKKEAEYYFTGITERDTEGLISGNIDKSDWKMDDIWNEREEQLFDTTTFKYSNSKAIAENTNRSIMNMMEESRCFAYPNPAKSVLILRAQSEGITFRFVMVDNSFHIIYSGNQKIFTSLSYSLNVSDRKLFRVNNIYRVYYKIEYDNGNVEKGHGDVKIIE